MQKIREHWYVLDEIVGKNQRYGCKQQSELKILLNSIIVELGLLEIFKKNPY